MTCWECTRCGRPADSIHILPWVRDATRVELACRRHDPGGYWFYIPRWFDDGPDIRGGDYSYTMRDHLLDKYRGHAAVALVDQALVRGRHHRPVVYLSDVQIRRAERER